jgi:hypothetical protein
VSDPKVAQLIEKSSLGTAGARRLRARADASTVAFVMAWAYFADSDADQAWWEANQHNPDALRSKAHELAAAGVQEMSDVLMRMAENQQEIPRPAR